MQTDLLRDLFLRKQALIAEMKNYHSGLATSGIPVRKCIVSSDIILFKSIKLSRFADIDTFNSVRNESFGRVFRQFEQKVQPIRKPAGTIFDKLTVF